MKSSWEHPASVVPDKTLFLFSKPNLSEAITSNLPDPKSNSQATGKLSGLRSTTTFFSNLLSPSVSEEAGPSSSMKQENQSRSLKAISPSLHDDLAFSSDPHVHPFFSISHDDWTCPPMVGHPTLRKDIPRLPHLVIPTGDMRNSGEFRLIQPPNSPMSPERSPTSHSPTPPTPPPKPHLVTLPPITVTTDTPSRSAPSLVQSHSDSHANLSSTSGDPSPLPVQKKKNPLAMLLRKSPPVSLTEQDVNFGQNPHSEVAPPSYETIFSDPPSSVPSDSPEAKTQSSTSLSTHSTLKSADSQESIDTYRSAVGRHRKHKNRLDRIDELDETNPSGIPIHHGGPYEAIYKLAHQSRRSEPHNIGSQYAISGSSKHGSSASGSMPPTPTPVSLNLSPGQILPRDFNDYYNPYTGIINTPPVPHPPSNGRHRTITSREHEPRDNWDRQQQWQQPTASTSTQSSVPIHTHLPHVPSQQVISSRVATIPSAVEYQNVPSRAASSREGYNHAQHDFHPPMLALPPLPPPPPKISTGKHDQGNIVHTSSEAYNYTTKHNIHTPMPAPPLAQSPGGHERYNQSNNLHPSRDGFNPHLQRDIYPSVPAPPPPQDWHEHDNQSNIVRSSREGYNHPVQYDAHPPVPPPLPAQPLTGGHDRHYQDNVVHTLTEHVPRVDVRPSTPPGQTQQPRDRDVQSTHRSLISNGSTFNTRNGAMPQPRHLPKKLIMPAPLQQALPVPSRDQSHLSPSHVRYDARSQPQQFPSRPPSPPSSLHPSFDSAISRAKDIPMSAGRKLRKQNSISGIPPPLVHDKQVSFSANVGYSEPLPALAPSKTMKVPKRVLSKRRTNL